MKIFLRNCSIVFLIMLLCTIGFANEQFPFLAEVIKTSVNVRSGANTNFDKIIQLKQGDEVLVLGKSYDWYKIQLPSFAKSYVRADYLMIQQGMQAQVIGDKVNIRLAPNSDAASLGILNKGDVVQTVILSNGWWQIQPPPKAVGWVRQDFLSVKSLSAQKKEDFKPLKTLEVQGKLQVLQQSNTKLLYELLVNDQVAYYVQSVPNIEQFNGAYVSIKGLVIPNQNNTSYPILHTINISLLL